MTRPPPLNLTGTVPLADRYAVRQDRPQMILTITQEGEIKRHDKPLEELSREELIAVVRELVQMITKGRSLR